MSRARKADKVVVAFIEGDDCSQRFFDEEAVRRQLEGDELAWWEAAKPGDMYRMKAGGYFPGTDYVIIKLGTITDFGAKNE